MLTNFKDILAAHLVEHLEFAKGKPAHEIVQLLELPKDSKLGDLALPCFMFAKAARKAPPMVAQECAKLLENNLPKEFKKVQTAGGYLNFFFNDESWAQIVLTEIYNTNKTVGHRDVGKGKTVVIDYSSPNVAKPMSIGHLRSTVIGQSLVNVFRSQGYKTIGINYLGDWGVQFGKLAWAHIHKADLLKRAHAKESEVMAKDFSKDLWKKLISDIEKDVSGESFDYLYALYVVFHALVEVDDTLEDLGRSYFLKLEQRSDKKIEDVWKKFVQISLVEYKRVYKLLGIELADDDARPLVDQAKDTKDPLGPSRLAGLEVKSRMLVGGESQHEAELIPTVELIKQKLSKVMTTQNLPRYRLSEGAMIVDLEDEKMPPCLIQKSDGATLYATRDIAAALFRHKELGGDRLIYVVGAEQTLHFRQFFKVLELMDQKWVKDCEHVPFGLYRFKEGKMSTRRGNVVFLEDVLERAIELVKKIIEEKNPDLKDQEKNSVAEIVGTGAVVFNDLMNDRQKNIDFDWDKLLDFNGDTGPYVQYTFARCNSVIEKGRSQGLIGNVAPAIDKLNLSLISESQEKTLLRTLGLFDDAVRLTYEQLKPSWIAQYLLDLCKSFNHFYHDIRVLEGTKDQQLSRLALVGATQKILGLGLGLLGIRAPKEM